MGPLPRAHEILALVVALSVTRVTLQARCRSCPPDADDPLDDHCDGLAHRTFRSLAEVKRAHAKCDHAHSVAPLWPPAEDQSDE
jgi:hypothetical protein